MRRLYLRIYLALVASLVVFALVAALFWRQFGESAPQHEMAAALASNVLPPASAPRAEQQAALEKLAAGLRADATLFDPDFAPLATVGEPLAPPRRRGWSHRRFGPPAWAVHLGDGRWLVARPSRERHHPALALFATLALLAAAVGVGAYPVVRRLTRRLERLQEGVESLGAGQLATRVKVEGKDEIGRLAESFNRAAARIEELVASHKVLLANASHELRTPLARIRMAVELMKENADPRRKRELEDDIAELDLLIDEIMLSSRLDAQERLERTEDVDVLALAAEECARYEAAMLEGERLTLRGDPRLLRRMIRNLLENARRHGAPPIEVRARDREIVVCDHGPGIPPDEREKVFEPFYRGLGLSIVRQIARRHGGDARCIGNCFVVSFPLGPEH